MCGLIRKLCIFGIFFNCSINWVSTHGTLYETPLVLVIGKMMIWMTDLVFK